VGVDAVKTPQGVASKLVDGLTKPMPEPTKTKLNEEKKL
jgi:hypothetical protein